MLELQDSRLSSGPLGLETTQTHQQPGLLSLSPSVQLSSLRNWTVKHLVRNIEFFIPFHSGRKGGKSIPFIVHSESTNIIFLFLNSNSKRPSVFVGCMFVDNYEGKTGRSPQSPSKSPGSSGSDIMIWKHFGTFWNINQFISNHNISVIITRKLLGFSCVVNKREI